MQIQIDSTSGASRMKPHRFALRRTGAWLVGACIALGACAEPAPTAARADAAAAGTQANPQAAHAMPVQTTNSAGPRSAIASASNAVPKAAIDPHAEHAAVAAAAPAASKPRTASADPRLPHMQVHKSPTCGCCSVWVDRMRAAGFTVDVHDTHDLAAVKSRLGVPADAQSCHTAEVGGLVVEGHVPADDIKRALAQGDTRALVLPGMPVGSPGMEVPGVDGLPYTVEAIAKDGTRTPFSTHDPDVPKP